MRPFLAAAGIALALTLSTGASGQTTTTPKLRVAGQMVIGVKFHARERVQVRFINDSDAHAHRADERQGHLRDTARPLRLVPAGADDQGRRRPRRRRERARAEVGVPAEVAGSPRHTERRRAARGRPSV